MYKKNIPQPHFVTTDLQSSLLLVDLSEIITKLDQLIPQFSEFIGQFDNIVINNNINVITEVNGYLSVDVPSSMSDIEANRLSERIGILKRLITTCTEEIDTLLHKELDIETKLKEQNLKYTSQILEKVKEYEKYKSKYKH